MIVCVPNRLIIFLFQIVSSATEAAKLFASHRASVLQQSSARGDRTCACAVANASARKKSAPFFYRGNPQHRPPGDVVKNL
jgi:hypothetical protein